MYKSARGQKWVDKDEKETESYSFFFFRDFYLTKKKKKTQKNVEGFCVSLALDFCRPHQFELLASQA